MIYMNLITCFQRYINMLHEQIKNLADEIGDVYHGNDWLIVKKYIIRYSNPKLRKNFSTRNVKNMKHKINEYEKHVIDYYYQKFNVRLELDEQKKDYNQKR